VTPTTIGQSTITIALAPASYSPPQSQQATVVATSTTLDLAAVTPTRWVGQGATMAVPLTVEALDLGTPKASVAVNFAVTRGTASLSSASAITSGSGFATVTAQLTNQNANVQVSACVAPNNAPCQTFTLFSTPPALWTLETVSGSLQFVSTGQAFQPLVMRVTDGSAAANPVMGVNVTFQTTLARVSPDQNGLAVILGSSQTQFVTTQDGLASILPSAGSVGPCDLFITVSVGASIAEFQMESLAAIVPITVLAPPTSSHVQIPVAPRRPQFGAQAAPPQGAPDELFAVPEVASTNDPPPAVDSTPSDCSKSSADAASADPAADHVAIDPASADHGGAASSIPAAKKNSVSPPCVKSKPVELKAPDNVVPVEIEVVPTKAPTPVEAQLNPASTSWLPEDKRSCRTLAGDGLLP